MADAVFFQFDTRSGDYQFGPDGSVQYSNIPEWMGSVVVSSGSTTVNGRPIPRGMQIWTVGTSGYYDILAGGASGASYVSDNFNYTAGRGIVVKSRQYLQAGAQIIILVGMRPAGCYAWRQSSGGGGTFVTKYAATDAFSVRSQHTPLLVAGGGGGLPIQTPYACLDGTLTSSGTKCSFNPPSNVSANGGGGGGYSRDGGDGVDGVAYFYNNGAGGGGGGFVGNGGYVLNRPSWGAKSFLAGGAGAQIERSKCYYGNTCKSGLSNSLDPISTCSYPAAGFGGGGEGTGISGGGGGGYSGGQGCVAIDKNNPDGLGGGGGGGSYDANALTATQYRAWNTDKFGPVPAYFEDGYMYMHGIVSISLSDTCALHSYDTGSACVTCAYCSTGEYADGCGGNSPGACKACTNTVYTS